MHSTNKKPLEMVQSDQSFSEHKEYRRNTKQKRKLFRRMAIFGLASIIILSFMFTNIWHQREMIKNKQIKEQQLSKTVTHLENKQGDLNEEIKKLNNKEYIGEIARRDYFLTKPNETLFKVAGDHTN